MIWIMESKNIYNFGSKIFDKLPRQLWGGLLQRCALNGVAWLVHDDDAYIKIFQRVHYDWNHKFSSKNHFLH